MPERESADAMPGKSRFGLIGAFELNELRQKVNVQIIDARRPRHFEGAHLQDAICLEWESFCEIPEKPSNEILKTPGWWGKLAATETEPFKQKLRNSGLTETEPIVIYADGSRDKGRDGRLAWMFLYLGAQAVLLLDGGIDAWMKAGFETTAEQRITTAKSFATTLEKDRRITIENLKTKFADLRMPMSIDTRSPQEFAGVDFDYQPRLGRIPGSINFPFTQLYRADQTFIGQGEFLNLLPPSAVPEFTYCEVGVRAATFALLYELYVGRILPVYDGSFMEWALEPDLELETGPQQTLRTSS